MGFDHGYSMTADGNAGDDPWGNGASKFKSAAF